MAQKKKTEKSDRKKRDTRTSPPAWNKTGKRFGCGGKTKHK